METFYAVVELMGHQKLVGKVSEITLAGTAMIRVDFNDGVQDRSKFFSGNAIYAITPIDQEAVAGLQRYNTLEPVKSLLTQRLTARIEVDQYNEEYDED